MTAPLAVFGGTFDPVHFGHLRTALELTELLDLPELRFMPAASPPHRETPAASAEDRVRMLELAVAGEPRFSCDLRELAREGPSYTVLSCEELRAEVGLARPLCIILGADALAGLHRWHRWEELLDLTNIIAVARPGWDWPAEGLVASLLESRHCDAATLRTQRAGGIFICEMRPHAISSSGIRALIQSGASPRYLLPESVLRHIQEHRLYGGVLPNDKE